MEIKNIKESLSPGKIEANGSEETTVIEMTLHDDLSFFSEFSDDNNPSISENVAGYIENHMYAYKPRTNICLKIKCRSADEQSKEQYRRAIHAYYSRSYADNERALRFNTAASLFMFIIGLFSMGIYVTLSYAGLTEVWQQVLYIFAWVFLSEAVTLFFLQRRSLSQKKKRYKRLIEMTILCVPLDSQL